MKLHEADSKQLDVTIQRHKFGTLMYAAKWILNGQKGRVPREARDRLRELVESYDSEYSRLYEEGTHKVLPVSDENN